MINFDNHIIKSIDEFAFVSNTTGDILFRADELNEAGSLSNGEDIVYGTGSNGARISSMKRNKTASYSATNGFISLNQFAAQSGTEVFTSGDTTKILSEDIELLPVTINESVATAKTSRAAVGTAGSEILALYKANADGTQGAKYEQAATASATKFAYDEATQVITLPTDEFEKDDKVLVRYEYNTDGKKVSNKKNTYSKDGKAILKGTCCSPCDQETLYVVKFIIPFATLSGAYDVNFGGDQVTHPFSCESLPNPCDKHAELWYYIVEEDEEEEESTGD